jgi:hypothetical protein
MTLSSNVMTKNASDRILEAAKFYYNIGLHLATVNDLIAAEAKYHLNCLSTFYRSVSKTKMTKFCSDLAMVWLCQELCTAILQLNYVWACYIELS